MSPMFLVAIREFRQITSTRSFWLTLLLVPAAFVLSQIASRSMATPPGVAYVLVDATGRYAAPVEHRIALIDDRQVLNDLATYAQRWKIAPPGGAVWAGGPRWFSDADVARFDAAGGLPAAQAQIARLKPKDAPDFKASAAQFTRVEPPPGVVTADGPDRFGETLAPHLKGDVATPAGPRPLSLAVYVPANFGEPGAPVRMWTNGRPNADLVEAVRQELSQALRVQALQASGVDLAALGRAQAISAPVTLTEPPAGTGRDRMITKSILPLVLAYLLLISLTISGAWMLQSLVEERSNKLLEAVLACITPDELLYGKLMGALAVGMVMIGAWIGAALIGAYSVQGVVADFLRPALASLSSPWIIAALIYYFVVGYLCVAMIFVAIGSVSDTMREAQGYLMPITMGITLPLVLMVSAVVRSPDPPVVRIMSWIPVYSPFAMLLRLGAGVSPWEVLGSAAVLAAFVALELLVLGRLFRASILNAGQGLSPRRLIGLLRSQPAA